MKKYVFFSPHETKEKKYNYSLWRSFFLKLFMFFFVKTKVKALVLWKKNGSRIRSSIHDLKRENWSVKQPIWILGILEGNWEALFYINHKHNKEKKRSKEIIKRLFNFQEQELKDFFHRGITYFFVNFFICPLYC